MLSRVAGVHSSRWMFNLSTLCPMLSRKANNGSTIEGNDAKAPRPSSQSLTLHNNKTGKTQGSWDGNSTRLRMMKASGKPKSTQLPKICYYSSIFLPCTLSFFFYFIFWFNSPHLHVTNKGLNLTRLKWLKAIMKGTSVCHSLAS